MNIKNDKNWYYWKGVKRKRKLTYGVFQDRKLNFISLYPRFWLKLLYRVIISSGKDTAKTKNFVQQ